ncbi:MAG: hypothetical protein GH155_01255 [Spirochaeta sp.]|nr:hypothetical protein [Spirochaeta sp.]
MISSRLKAQRHMLLAGFIFNLLLIVIFLIAKYLLLHGGLLFEQLHPGLLILLLFSLFANMALRNLYIKTSSLEVFFLFLFLLSLTLESLRGLAVLPHSLNAPLYIRNILSRSVYWGRVFGLLCLFTSSLYGVGFKYSNHSALVIALLLISLVLGSILPLDITATRGELLYKLGDSKGYMFLSYTLGLLLIINFLAAAFIRLSKRFLIIALAGLLLLVGRELVFSTLEPLFFLPGLVLLVLGTFIFSRQIGVFYLWV